MPDMKIIHLDTSGSTDEALAVLDDLRAHLESGEVVAFLVAAVSPSDEVSAYSATTRGVSRLRMIGAMTMAVSAMTNGEV